MDTLPEFVVAVAVESAVRREEEPALPQGQGERTGWESVVFQVEDEPGSDSDFSTAAIAP
jgi:hypothetical protein